MFFLGKRDWARSHNQALIVHCLVEPFLHPHIPPIHIVNEATANFLMVVIPAVLAHDVSARAGDVSMGIAVFPIGWIY